MMKLVLILLLLATPANAGLDYFSKLEKMKVKPEPVKIERNYTLIKKSDLTSQELEFVKEHEKQSADAMNSYSKGEYEVDCLNLVEKIIEQSYEGCIMTTNLKTNVADIASHIPDIEDKQQGKELDIKEQTKAHNAHLKEMKKSLCKSAMKAAKYHKQQTYCRRPQSKQWYEVANNMLDLKIYKYIGIYIKKTDIIWRGLPDNEYIVKNGHDVLNKNGKRAKNEVWKTFDHHYKNHPAQLAGNVRNMAYDTDHYYQEVSHQTKFKKDMESSKKYWHDNHQDVKFNYSRTKINED